MTGFDINLRENFIKNLCKKYRFIKCGIIGKSLCGRKLQYLKIGSDNSPVLFVSAFHGMEWLTSLLVLKFVESISKAIYYRDFVKESEISERLKEKGLVVIPCINPDGVEISINGAKTAGIYESFVKKLSKNGKTNFWQANARGVDLNHNFDANWNELHELEKANGIKTPGPTRYGGMAPESELETKALSDFCRKMNFRHVVAFHSQGEEIYWEFGEKTPQKAKIMAKKMSKLSGYKLSEPQGLAVGGGFKDWFVSKFEKPGFTVEIGKGKNPLLFDAFDGIYAKLEKMLLYCALA